MKFENKLNKDLLEEALINWVLGSDGKYDETFYEIFDTIPWDNKMEKIIPCSDICADIDKVIGKRGDFNMYRLLKSNPTTKDLEYKNKFNTFIQSKIKNIAAVYEKKITELNKILSRRGYSVK